MSRFVVLGAGALVLSGIACDSAYGDGTPTSVTDAGAIVDAGDAAVEAAVTSPEVPDGGSFAVVDTKGAVGSLLGSPSTYFWSADGRPEVHRVRQGEDMMMNVGSLPSSIVGMATDGAYLACADNAAHQFFRVSLVQGTFQPLGSTADKTATLQSVTIATTGASFVLGGVDNSNDNPSMSAFTSAGAFVASTPLGGRVLGMEAIGSDLVWIEAAPSNKVRRGVVDDSGTLTIQEVAAENDLRAVARSGGFYVWGTGGGKVAAGNTNSNRLIFESPIAISGLAADDKNVFILTEAGEVYIAPAGLLSGLSSAPILFASGLRPSNPRHDRMFAITDASVIVAEANRLVVIAR